MTLSIVSGGAGFIGSHLTERLLAAGHDVRVLDDLSNGLMSNLDPVIDSIEFVKGDLRDRPTVDRVVKGADFVFHLGALGSVPRSIASPMDTHDVNATGTLNMLLAARDAGVTKFVSASSSSVYGDHPALPKCEPNTGRPLSPYASTKSMGEQYCRQFWDFYELPTTALRFFNVFGPRQRADHVYAAVIPLFIDAALRGEALKVNGDGTYSRDFTYVGDNVGGIVATALAPIEATAGKVFNLARGGRLTLLDLITIVEDCLGSSVQVEHRENRPGDIPHSFADIAAIQEATGYEAQTTIEQGVQATVDWFRTLPGYPAQATQTA